MYKVGTRQKMFFCFFQYMKLYNVKHCKNRNYVLFSKLNLPLETIHKLRHSGVETRIGRRLK